MQVKRYGECLSSFVPIYGGQLLYVSALTAGHGSGFRFSHGPDLNL